MGAPATDQDFVGAELVVGDVAIGRVQAVLHDPISHRVRHLVARYGTFTTRRVAVPVEWIVRRGPQRVVLGVERRSLDQLATLDGYLTRPRPLRPTEVAGAS
jgi:hypothetical protein